MAVSDSPQIQSVRVQLHLAKLFTFFPPRLQAVDEGSRSLRPFSTYMYETEITISAEPASWSGVVCWSIATQHDETNFNSVQSAGPKH